MIASTPSRPDERTTVSVEGSIEFDAALCWPWCSSSSAPKMIAQYKAENKPGGADRALQRPADLRFSDTRVVADRHFNYAESRQGAFQDQLNGPAVAGLFEAEPA